jgi:hypothetical protein
MPCVYWILETGPKVLAAPALGSRKSYGTSPSLLDDLTTRGLEVPMLVILDGQPRLRQVLWGMFLCVCYQRCLPRSHASQYPG